MISSEALTHPPLSTTYHAAPFVALDADFETRWAAWVARGRVHEKRVRRRFAVWAVGLTLAAAILYAF
jgi:hypothetical protein